MTIFIPKPWVNSFGKMSLLRLFQLLVFITWKGLYSFQNIVKDIFLAYFALKKKVRRMAILIPKSWVDPFGKMSIFDFFNFLFSYPRKAFICSRISSKKLISSLFCLKKKVRKIAILIPKPWVNPFGKMSLFRLFQLVVFITWKGIYSFQNIVKDIFLANFA